MKPVDTTALDVRRLFDLIHHYNMNYDMKNVNRYKIKENALNLIKSMILFAWTDEADILHPTELQIKQFVTQGMRVTIKSTGLKPEDRAYDKEERTTKITVNVSIDYPDESLSIVLVDYTFWGEYHD